MCQMGNKVLGGFCLLLKRAGCGMLGKGKRQRYLSCVFMLFSSVHEEKRLAQVREAPWGRCAAQVSPEHSANLTMSNFMGCCPRGLVWVSPECHHDIHVTIAFLPEIRRTPLSAQSHHLMRSQLRSSLGLTPGNWHYLGSQGIHRIIKFFKGFWGYFFFYSV